MLQESNAGIPMPKTSCDLTGNVYFETKCVAALGMTALLGYFLGQDVFMCFE
jgi:hypothetical protein